MEPIKLEEKSSEELGLILLDIFKQMSGLDDAARKIESILRSRIPQVTMTQTAQEKQHGPIE